MPDNATIIDTHDADTSLSKPFRYLSRISIASGLLAIYIATIHRGIPGGDSGELLAVACSWGVAHAPGYPLWTLLYGTFIKMSPMEPAVSGALLSTWLSAGAAVCFFNAAIILVPRQMPAAFIAVIVYSLSPTIWQYATVAEVFALHQLLTAAFIWFFLSKRWKLMALVAGLGLSNQHTLILFVIPVILITIWQFLESKEYDSIIDMAIWGFVGLLPYLYLPLAAIFSESWSKWGDTRTLSGFTHHLLRRDYGTFRLGRTELWLDHWFDRLILYIMNATRETMGVGILALASIGLIKRKTLVLLLCLSTYVLVFVTLSNLPIDSVLMRSVQRRFYPQANMAVILLATPVIGAFLSRLKGKRTRRIVIGYVVIVLVASQIAMNPPQRGGIKAIGTFGEHILAPIPPKSLLLTKGDININSVRYLQQCRGLREDVTIIDQETMSYEWYVPQERRDVTFPGRVYNPYDGGFSIDQFIRANVHKFGGGVWVSGGWKDGDESGEANWDREFYGIVAKLRARSHPFDVHQWVSSSRAHRERMTRNLVILNSAPMFRNRSSIMSQLEEWEWLVSDDAYRHTEQWAYSALVLALRPEIKDTRLGPGLLLEVIDVLEHLTECVAPVGGDEPRIPGRVPAHIRRNIMIAVAHMHGRDLKGGSWRCRLLDAIRLFLEVADPNDKDTISARSDYARERRHAQVLRADCEDLKFPLS